MYLNIGAVGKKTNPVLYKTFITLVKHVVTILAKATDEVMNASIPLVERHEKS